jgi:hypothetical protein
MRAWLWSWPLTQPPELAALGAVEHSDALQAFERAYQCHELARGLVVAAACVAGAIE